MSGDNNKKLVRISNNKMKKVSPRRLKNIFDAIGRRIFSKVPKNEVAYGQTLSKKRRKNCILKSVSSLSCPEDDNGFRIHSPYHINFRFTREDSHFRGSVMNFQKINVGESCCEKCMGTMKKGDSLSRFSISSDSACDVSSESSCDDLHCKYRKSRKKKKSKSVKVVPQGEGRTVENFIRIHRENFIDDVVVNPIPKMRTNESINSFWEWTEEELDHQSGVHKSAPVAEDPQYDILVTKSGCKVLEPSYENLKLVENFYEMPELKKSQDESRAEEPTEKTKEVVQSNKTYDEVIESLKLWHLSPRYPGECQNCSCCGERIENEFNHCVEGYESLENDFNNDIEEFCC